MPSTKSSYLALLTETIRNTPFNQKCPRFLEVQATLGVAIDAIRALSP